MYSHVCTHSTVDSSPPGQNGHHLADGIFRCIFVNEKFGVFITISLKFVPWGTIDNIPVLVQIMVWHGRDDKPLSEATPARFTDAYMRH